MFPGLRRLVIQQMNIYGYLLSGTGREIPRPQNVVDVVNDLVVKYHHSVVLVTLINKNTSRCIKLIHPIIRPFPMFEVLLLCECFNVVTLVGIYIFLAPDMHKSFSND